MTLALAGILLTLSMFLAGCIYWTGHLSARVQELERWRVDMRKDMHEISETLQGISRQLAQLTTMVDERTERRHQQRT